MAIILNQKMVLSAKQGSSSGKPLIGWRNYVGFGNITAEYEDPFYPVTNLGNSATNSEWRSTSADEQTIEVEIGGGLIVDYIALARHNLGSSGTIVYIDALIAGEDQTDWLRIFDGQILGSDRPAILRFEELYPTRIRVTLVPDGIIPRIAVFYIGKLTVMEKGMLQDVTPILYANRTDVVTGRSESGDFLGRIITDQTKEVSYSFESVNYDWFKQEMGEFAEASMTRPFFFAWLPAIFPEEVGYGWLNNDLNPAAFHYTGGIHVNFSLDITAIA